MTADELRSRLITMTATPPPDVVVYGAEVMGMLTKPPRPAAVLVPVVLGEAPGILLTKRTSHLKDHAGQVSFPGGRTDPDDPHPEATALREAEEEIALDPTNVRILGRMSDHVTGTGYRITPVIGLVPPGLAYRPAPYEVEAIFELPIGVLMDPHAPKRQQREVNGRMRDFWVWPHPEHFIWGATAAILVHLAEQLREIGDRVAL